MQGLAGAVYEGITSAYKGLSATLGHLAGARTTRADQDIASAGYFDDRGGIATLSYPAQQLIVPTLGRYKLDCVIEDCIVCDKCARICPVDCIDIVPIRSAETFGYTSDGTAKRIYAARFDIDMAKCCYCGLCTTVCPTECLTMTPEFDFSVQDLTAMSFPFATMSATEAAQKEADWQAAQAAKAAAKTAPPTTTDTPPTEAAPAAKKPYKPIIKKKD